MVLVKQVQTRALVASCFINRPQQVNHAGQSAASSLVYPLYHHTGLILPDLVFGVKYGCELEVTNSFCLLNVCVGWIFRFRQ